MALIRTPARTASWHCFATVPDRYGARTEHLRCESLRDGKSDSTSDVSPSQSSSVVHTLTLLTFTLSRRSSISTLSHLAAIITTWPSRSLRGPWHDEKVANWGRHRYPFGCSASPPQAAILRNPCRATADMAESLQNWLWEVQNRNLSSGSEPTQGFCSSFQESNQSRPCLTYQMLGIGFAEVTTSRSLRSVAPIIRQWGLIHYRKPASCGIL